MESSLSQRNGEIAHLHPVNPDRVAEARSRLLSAGEASRLASLPAMMAEPARARIMCALDSVDELCVGDLVLVLDASHDAVGYGLRMLRTAGLVVNRRAGRVIYYRLADDFPAALRQHCLHGLVELTRTRDGGEMLTHEEVAR